MKITETMDRSRAIEIGNITIMPMIDYPDGTPSVWIELMDGEGAQFPAQDVANVIKLYFDKHF